MLIWVLSSNIFAWKTVCAFSKIRECLPKSSLLWRLHPIYGFHSIGVLDYFGAPILNMLSGLYQSSLLVKIMRPLSKEIDGAVLLRTSWNSLFSTQQCGHYSDFESSTYCNFSGPPYIRIYSHMWQIEQRLKSIVVYVALLALDFWCFSSC